jgi:hypothetical protein
MIPSIASLADHPSGQAALREKFIGRMQPQVLVQRGGQRALRKGALPNVHVRCADGRRGTPKAGGRPREGVGCCSPTPAAPGGYSFLAPPGFTASTRPSPSAAFD